MDDFRLLLPSRRYSTMFNKLLQIAIDKNIEDYAYHLEVFRGLWMQWPHFETIFIDTYKVKGKELLFTLAHEIAHSILHRGKINQAAYFSDKEYRDKFECEANAYAAKLLHDIKGDAAS